MKAQFNTGKLSTKVKSAAAFALTVALISSLMPVAAIAFPGLATTPNVALAQSADAPLGFPRLGMWYPDPWSQDLADIARYDYVVIPDAQGGTVAGIKAINPDIIVLNPTNACELDFRPDQPASAEVNAPLAEAPTDWLLTQVGSTLAAPVNATSSTLQLEDVNSTLFRVGDLLVIEDELALVEVVGASTLTVRRGVVKPAASHASGTRVAAVAMFWPQSPTFDLSESCPEVVVDPAVGPETWVEWNARMSAALLDSADWDGLILDRTEQDITWLIGSSGARTLDPYRTNTPLEDRASYDASWEAGLARYEQILRDTVGDAILLPNGGLPNFDALNGSLHETFPSADTDSVAWNTRMFSEGLYRGSYTEWLSKAMQPNLTTLMVYDDETEPDALGGGHGTYENPAEQPGYTPNYQKMRYGLATTLMGDGYYNYQVALTGLGALGLLWFDEFDNAGAGKGYLGQPLGDPYKPLQDVSGSDILDGNGQFDTSAQAGAWDLSVWNGYSATASFTGGTAQVDVSTSSGDMGGVSLDYHLGIDSLDAHTLTFRARSSEPVSIQANVMKGSSPWALRLGNWVLDLTSDWQTFEFSGYPTAVDGDCYLQIGVGGEPATVWVDDVELTVGGAPDVWQRDYEGGTALVNPTDETVSIDLGHTFRKIDGTQDRSVNDGSLVTEVTLQGQDGIVLLRETPADDPPADDPPAEDPPADDPPADDPPAEDPPVVNPPAADLPVDGIGCGPNGVDYECISGPDRYATAVEISKQAFPNGADTVVIATGQNWPDALGGGALAGTYDAPILLTESGMLPDIVAAEIRRLGAKQAIVLGGKLVVQPTVEWELREAGIISITRYGGWTRYQTAELIAEATIERLGDDWDGTALVATGKNFPDALAGSPLASAAGWPLYLAEPGSSGKGLSEQMRADGVTKAILLGGAASVESACEMALRDNGTTILRLAGGDRYETAAVIAEFAVDHGGLEWNAPSISTGENFPDALAGGMLCAKKGSVLVLTASRSVPAASANVLGDNKAAIEEVAYLGGPGAVSEAVRNQIADVLE